MNHRQLCKALEWNEVKELIEAEHFAQKRGTPLNTTINIHPKLLDAYPEDLGKWTSDLLNNLRIWCNRAGFGYFALWVRENYKGDRHEHLHVLLHVSNENHPALEAALRRWLPGKDEVVFLGRARYRADRFGRRVNTALTYLIKQMTPQAHFALNRGVRRENKCRKTGVPVAPVLGKRCGISRSLDREARATWAAAYTTRSGTRPLSSERDIKAGQAG
jgi:hypothetical protein